MYVYIYMHYWGLAISTLCGNRSYDDKLEEVYLKCRKDHPSLIGVFIYPSWMDCLLIAGWPYTLYIHIVCFYHGTCANRHCTISTKRCCLDRFDSGFSTEKKRCLFVFTSQVSSTKCREYSHQIFHIAISSKEMILSSLLARLEHMNGNATCLDPILFVTPKFWFQVLLITDFHDICYVSFLITGDLFLR